MRGLTYFVFLCAIGMNSTVSTAQSASGSTSALPFNLDMKKISEASKGMKMSPTCQEEAAKLSADGSAAVPQDIASAMGMLERLPKNCQDEISKQMHDVMASTVVDQIAPHVREDAKELATRARAGMSETLKDLSQANVAAVYAHAKNYSNSDQSTVDWLKVERAVYRGLRADLMGEAFLQTEMESAVGTDDVQTLRKGQMAFVSLASLTAGAGLLKLAWSSGKTIHNDFVRIYWNRTVDMETGKVVTKEATSAIEKRSRMIGLAAWRIWVHGPLGLVSLTGASLGAGFFLFNAYGLYGVAMDRPAYNKLLASLDDSIAVLDRRLELLKK